MRTRALVFATVLFTAGILATPSHAQDQSQPAPPPAPAAQQDPSTALKPAAEKKVWWTNDDFAANQPAKPAASAKPAAKSRATPAPKGKDAKWYHAQLEKLNGQVTALDKKIAAYQDALDGKQVPNGGLLEGHFTRADWPAEVEKLRKQRADLLARISALQDEARHNGIDPNQLP